jgi:hypothetical protein
LEKKDGKIYGRVSDQHGTQYKNPFEINNFSKNSFKFIVYYVSSSSSGEKVPMNVNISNKDSTTMRGKFELPDLNVTGVWVLERQAGK